MKIRDIEDKQVRERAVELASTSKATKWRIGSGIVIQPDNVEDYYLTAAFDWGETTEGYTYWLAVQARREDEYKKPNTQKMCPEEPAKKDDQINPNHYKDNLFGKELQYVMIDMFGKKEYKIFCKLNAFKYRMRAGKKADKAEQDIQKAMWYEEKLKSL